MDYAAIIEFVIQQNKPKGVNLNQLSKKLEVTATHMSRLRKGKHHPTVKLLNKILKESPYSPITTILLATMPEGCSLESFMGDIKIEIENVTELQVQPTN